MKTLSALLFNRVLPSHCLLCLQKTDSALCSSCCAELPWIVNACYNCGIPMPTNESPGLKNAFQQPTDQVQKTTLSCGKCLAKPPSFDRCIPAFSYDSPVDNLISRFKHHRSLLAGNVLANLLWHHLAPDMNEKCQKPDFMVPVPLHWFRQITRGFNQSAFIASRLSQLSDIPVFSIAHRKKSTPKQQFLNRKQRLKNLKNTFYVDAQKVKGKHIAIIDDVMTTGATAEALSAEMKKAGAARIDIWCLGRTPMHLSG